MKLRFIAVSYEHRTELEVFLGSLLLQTNHNWTCEVWYDGPIPDDILKIISRYNDERIIFKHTPERNGKYGHISRRIALEELDGDMIDDFVIHTNTDNYMVPGFVSQMLGAVKYRENVGIVMCDTIHSHLDWGYHHSQLFEGGVDMGAFIVRADVAKKVGFNWTHFSADGKYAEECAKECMVMGLVAVHIERGLFVHN